MKKCPKCGADHEKPGIYCSRKCANSKVFSEETRKLKSDANKKHWASLTSEEQATYLKLRKTPEAREKQKETWLSKAKSRPFEELGWGTQRRLVIHDQEGKCNHCKLQSWMGFQIPLEVDHINGVNSDNRRENLEALCPNCHAMTPTWRGRNKSNNTKVSDDEIIQYLGESKNVRQALLKAGVAAKGSNYKRAKGLLKT